AGKRHMECAGRAAAATALWITLATGRLRVKSELAQRCKETQTHPKRCRAALATALQKGGRWSGRQATYGVRRQSGSGDGALDYLATGRLRVKSEIAAVRARHAAVMAPTSSRYFDSRPTAESIEAVYQFDPLPENQRP
ncbi:MAG TPA: hypothetical protein VNB49_07210, partial [Candidatus Dormibacteraeota bacterium]|nr:hypothetical protein [Candidatus Dormibacteraeota bacterium]